MTNTERNQKESTDDININITNWSKKEGNDDLVRIVTFDTPVNVPRMITSMMNLGDTITCRLDETLHWVEPEKEFTVHSRLSFDNVPAIGKDQVRIEINYQATRVTLSRTHMVLSVSCEFLTRIWGIAGIVENFMEKDAHKSFQDWIDLAERHLREFQQQEEEEEEEILSLTSPSSTSYRSVQSQEELVVEEEGKEEQEDQVQERSISQLLQRSYTLASLKRDLREVRALVSKTEVRVLALEEECSNHQLDLTVSRYLQRVEQLFNQQSLERDQARDRLQQTQQYIEAVLARYRSSSSMWWFFTGSFITTLFTVILPLCVWYFAIKRRRK